MHKHSFTQRQPSEQLEIILEPGRADNKYWEDIWHYRELFAILAWRDIAVRYKQTVVGISWGLIRPFATMVIFTIVFGNVAKLPSDGLTPYPIMVFAAILPWFLLSTILSDASNSVITNSALVSKIYFPRLIIPSAAAVAATIDFILSVIILVALFVWYDFWPDWRIVFLPAFTILAIATALGPALLLSALNVKYRDFRYIIPFILQFGLYISPVGFSSSQIPSEWRLLYSLNPLVSVIDGFRWCVLSGQASLNLTSFIMGLIMTALLLWLGFTIFRRTERSFADTI